MIARLFPHPLLSLALLLGWLLLNMTLSAGHVVLGSLIGMGIPLLTEPYWRSERVLHKPRVLLRLAPVVLWDIIVANFRVARLVLGPIGKLQPRFFEVPLASANPYAVTALASIVSLAPGSVSCEVSGDGKRLLVHGLHVPDEAAAIAEIKTRYETLVDELFEG